MIRCARPPANSRRVNCSGALAFSVSYRGTWRVSQPPVFAQSGSVWAGRKQKGKRKAPSAKRFVAEGKTEYISKSRTFLPTSFFKTSNLFKQISNEPLQKSNTVSEANFPSKPENNVSAQEETLNADPSKPKETLNLYVNLSSHLPDSEAPLQSSPSEPPPHSLVQRKDTTEVLLNADPFEEVPGPELLKKLSRVWKFLPEIGCQATVSAMLSFFNLSQRLSVLTKLVRPNARPFDGLFRKHGPIVKLQGPLGADVVLICKPEHVARVYDQEGKHPVRSTLDSVEKCRAHSRKNCGGPFNLSGVEWEEMRRAIQEPLSRGGERYFEAIQEAAEMFVRRIRVARNRQNEVGEDFMTEVTKWGLECLCHVTLGKSLGFHNPENVNASAEPQRLLKAVMDATTSICKCESGFQLWRFMNTTPLLNLSQACEVIDAFISKHVRLAQVNLTKNKEEILSKKSDAGLPFIENLLLNECMAPDEVLTCIVDLLLIGVNTTSSSLAFTLYHLAQNQRAQRVLFKEVKEVLPGKESQVQYRELPSLKYLEACIRESHRLTMPMPILTRVLPCDVALSNFRIPKGTYMVMDVQATCLKEQNFERCNKFLPERWADPSNVQPFSFIPFGYGSRSCVGKQLAEVQLKTCLAKIVRNYQIEYNYGDIQGTKTVISFPDKPLKLAFMPRDE